MTYEKFTKAILYRSVRVWWTIKRAFFRIVGISVSEQLPYDWKEIGLSRTDVINKLIKMYGYNSYLEIGCQSDVNFAKVPVPSKIGVDPVSGGTHRITSDKFFENNDKFFDLVFIDGLHTYEQARRDVINSLRYMKKGGVIVLHDMLPLSWASEHMPRLNGSSSGTVWKLVYELKKNFGNKFCIIIADTGLGVIFCDENLNPNLFKDDEFKKNDKRNYRNLLEDYKSFNLIDAKRTDDVLTRRSI